MPQPSTMSMRISKALLPQLMISYTTETIKAFCPAKGGLVPHAILSTWPIYALVRLVRFWPVRPVLAGAHWRVDLAHRRGHAKPAQRHDGAACSTAVVAHRDPAHPLRAWRDRRRHL